MHLIEVIPDKCTGCELCVMACSFHHEQECSRTKSRIKILKGREWAFDFPVHCIQCATAPCIESCPMDALHRDEATGVVLVDADACNGCEACINVCPIDALALDEDRDIVFKCDLCGGDPECVKWCTRDVLVLKEVDLDSPDRKAYMDKASETLQAVG